MKHKFENWWTECSQWSVPNGFATVENIESTPMLFGADIEFALNNGGDLTRSVLSQILEDISESQRNCDELPYIVIDTKVVMLMEGMYPAIPGWHCDAVPRNDRYAQPDVTLANNNGFHWVCNVSNTPDGTSQTLFLNQDATIDIDEERVWGSVNDAVEKNYNHSIVEIPDRKIIKFNQNTLHSAAPAHTSGWRWFFRASMYRNPPLNKIRDQVQVYANPNKGW